MDFINPFNDLAKDIFSKQPIIIVLFLIFMFLLLVFYATRTVSKQQTEDHKEKGLLIDLVKESNSMFGALRDAIDSLRVSQEKRNEALAEQLKEQKETNKNISALNIALAANHSDFVDTITVVLKNQVTGRLDRVEQKVDEVYEIVTTKTDCNDLVLEKISNLSTDIQILKDTLIKKEE